MTNQKGQAVLVVLLVMAVAVTVVLSVVASSTSDIRIGTTETQSLRAFSAAEAGIEKALVANSSTQGIVGNATYNATVSGLGQGKNNFVYPADIAGGDNGFIWFVSHADNGTLVCDASHTCFTGNTVKVCWGKQGSPDAAATTPALEVSIFYVSGVPATAKVAKAIYDPNGSRRSSNSYAASDAGGCSISQNQYAFQKQITLSGLGIPAAVYSVQNGLQFMSVKMLYNSDVSQPMGVDVNFAGNGLLPSQGNQVSSTGSLSQATRKIEVTRSYNQAPAIFDSAIFAPGGLAQ